jgi:hypothetical protein
MALVTLIAQMPTAAAQDYVCRLHKSAGSLPDDGPRELEGIGERFVIRSCTRSGSPHPPDYALVWLPEKRLACAYNSQLIFRHVLDDAKVEWTSKLPRWPHSHVGGQTFMSAAPEPCPDPDHESYILTDNISDGLFLKLHAFAQSLLKDRQKFAEALHNPIPPNPSIESIRFHQPRGGYSITFFNRLDVFAMRPGVLVDFEDGDIVVVGHSTSIQ